MAEAADLDSGTSQDLGGIGAQVAAVSSDLAKTQRAKIGAESRELKSLEKTQSTDRAQVEAAFKAEGAGQEMLKPWNAELEHQKFETSPIEGLGSTGAIFAMIASAFTRAPMLSALEGMTGALNGIKEGKESAYTRAYESWKENMKLAEQRQKMEHQMYSDALALSEHDQTASMNKLRAIAAQFDDQKMLTMIQHGMIPEIYQTVEARNRAMTSAMDVREQFTIRTAQDRALKTEFEAIDASQNLPPLMKEAKKAEATLRIYNKGNVGSGTVQSQLMSEFFRQNPGASAEDAADFAERHNILPKQPKPGDVADQRVFESKQQEWLDAHPDQDSIPADVLEKMRNESFRKGSSAGSTGMSAQESAAVEDELKKDPNLSRTDAIAKVRKAASARNLNTLSAIDAGEVKRRQEVYQKEGMEENAAFEKARGEVQAARTGGKLPDDVLRAIGAEKAAGDNSGMVGLSPYNRMRANEFAVETVQKKAQDRRSQLEKAHPDWDKDMLDQAARATPEQLGDTLAKAGASYQGLRAALRTLDNRLVTIQSAAGEAKKFMTLAKESSDKVPRSNVQLMNKMVQVVKTGISDPDLKEFSTNNNALVNQYVRAITGTGAPTDMVRKHAYEILQTVDGPAAYESALRVMSREMDAAIQAPEEVKAYILGESSNLPGSTTSISSLPSARVITYDKQGNRVQ